MTKNKPGFLAAQNKGVHITFDNGWMISIQWGPGNYCSNRDLNNFDDSLREYPASATAEIAIIKPDGSWHRFENINSVKGWCSVQEVLNWMNWTAARSSKA